jgi:RNA polymerase sigma factor (sigma-70 family)
MDLEETLGELAPQLLRYCLGRTGDAGAAEEVAQEALTALVQRWRRAGPPECPAAFVFAIARRRAGRLVLRRRLAEPLSILWERPHPAPDPAEQAAWRGDLAATLAALKRLPGRDREALLLVVAGELSIADGARVLGVSSSALKMRLHRARQRLLELVQNPFEKIPENLDVLARDSNP